MRKYELVCIIHPDLDETAFKGLVEKVSGWISESGGTIEKTDVWGRRRMAYQIRKQREGQYVLFEATLPPTATAELERNMRFQESILRAMITVVA
ncbi:MAG: 30S ribosomal protein S6 [Chloroflexi bacterium HGW-Chloroflexi-6]|jgi:small subunit ribosomal protein S6|nr:MAG: 30S ribosomal protein S6 [Chloroflexi bacterium HGW-Chloroflexi-6]